MKRWVPRLMTWIARPVLAMFGALGAFGAVVPATAAPLPERTALEARVADVRRHLDTLADGKTAGGSRPPTLIAQAGRWNNWPNWSNWANWRNG